MSSASLETDWEGWCGNLMITKKIVMKGPWGDSAMPLGAECCIRVSDSQGFLEDGSTTLTTGEADTAELRALEKVLMTMTMGEKSQIILFIDGVERGRATVELKELINAGPVYKWTEEKILEMAAGLKEKAVDLFKVGRTEDSFYLFSKAHSILVIGEAKDSDELKATLCSNMAACQLKKKNVENARDLSLMALELSPEMPKALYRLADSSIQLKEYEVAESSLKSLLKIEPSNKDALKLLAALKDLTKESDSQYKDMVQKMFS
ncbi:uncharacterized protein LOC135940870 [Cloeon dipterum]|uniref:uncharacterized protein LOC135940870 n=1 Tax=Cloeon dipterum TaxID=197152 RepID=UPI0032203125